MKTIILSCCSIFLIPLISFSQNQNRESAIRYYKDYTDYNGGLTALTKAKEKIELAAAHENTINDYKTWYYRGLIYLGLFDINLKTEANKSAQTDITKKQIAAYKTVSMQELEEALKSFQKEIELDGKKIYTNDANSKMKIIANIFVTKGDVMLDEKRYAEGLEFYEKSYEVKLKMNITDTTTLNNMAVAALNLKDYKKAEQLFQKLISLNYKPEKNYWRIILMYKDAGNEEALVNAIKKGREAYPDNTEILNEEINLYLKNGKNDEALKSLELAISKNTNNPDVYVAMGQTLAKMAFPKNSDEKDIPKPANYAELVKKAEDAYNQALQLKPDHFICLYNLAILYTNVGANHLKEANNIKDPKKAKTEEDKADAMFYKAIPLLEKAREIDKSDKDVIRALKKLYASTGQGESEKYKKLDAELKGVGK